MKNAFAILLLCLLLPMLACTSKTDQATGEKTTVTTIGDGVFDAKEQAAFKAAVGLPLSIKPDLAAPVYAVASIAVGLTSGSAAERLDAALKQVSVDLNLNAATLASLDDYLELIKVEIDTYIFPGGSSIDIESYGKILNQMLLIVQESAKERMI